jgi:hypothetical protein
VKLVPTENRQSVVRRNGKFFHEIGVAIDKTQLDSSGQVILVSDKVQEMGNWLSSQKFD